MKITKNELIKFIEDNFSYSNIGANEDGEYGEDKLNFMFKEGVVVSKELKEKIKNIIIKNGDNYYK